MTTYRVIKIIKLLKAGSEPENCRSGVFFTAGTKKVFFHAKIETEAVKSFFLVHGPQFFFRSVSAKDGCFSNLDISLI